MASRKSLQEGVQAIRSRLAELPGCLIIGPDRIRRRRVLDLLLESLRTLKISNVRRWSGRQFDALQLRDLVDGLRTLSLFEPRSAQLLSDAEELKIEPARGIADKVEASALHGILLIEASKLAAQHPLRKAFAKHSAVIELPELVGAELSRWVERELRTVGFSEVDRDVPRVLIERCGASPDSLATCIEQLSLYVDGATLGVKSITELYPADPQAQLFELVDTLSRRNGPRYLTHSAQLLRQGISPFALTTVLHRSLGQMLQVCLVRDTGRRDGESLHSALGAPPWLARRIAEQAGRITTNDALGFLDRLLTLDSKIKHRSLSMESVLSELLVP